MVKNSIKVYGRIKPVSGKGHAEEYEINHGSEDFETLTFTLKTTGVTGSKTEGITFRFQKVFDPLSNQEEIFEHVAKPVVDSVLQGYNGTIFAYGQTGSGKTYSMTGGSSHYEDRGIIPRTLQYMFQHLLESNATYTTYISYLEIYNECGYDLLNPNHKVSKLDDLPRVSLLEDTGGTLHLRNLSMHTVTSEQEARQLLFLGDTNRIISETPLNPSSSRSHCVFTVHVTIRPATGPSSSATSIVRRSKLHLVDLAGSERVHKTGIDGNQLVEARHINLSLHFLEQVIVALADSRRAHVPYRNSMMTAVLRDSLGGNCMTAMLATMSLNSANIDETISTCRFAQRVALVRNEALVNEERDPQQEIAALRADVRRLKDHIRALTTAEMAEELTEDEADDCRRWVSDFLRSSEEPSVPPDPRKVRLCLTLLREAALRSQGAAAALPSATSTPPPTQCTLGDQAERLRGIVRQRDSEISVLISLLRKEKQRTHAILRTPLNAAEYEPVIQRLTGQAFTMAESEAFKLFAADQNNRMEVENARRALKAKYEEAKALANTIEECRNQIVLLHNEIRRSKPAGRQRPDPKELQLREGLEEQQVLYRNALMELQMLKVQTGHQKHAMEQAKLRLLRNFQAWWSAQSAHAGTDSPGPGPGLGTPSSPQRPLSCQSTSQTSPRCLSRPGSGGTDKYRSACFPPADIWMREEALWDTGSPSGSRTPHQSAPSTPWHAEDPLFLPGHRSGPNTPWGADDRPPNARSSSPGAPRGPDDTLYCDIQPLRPWTSEEGVDSAKAAGPELEASCACEVQGAADELQHDVALTGDPEVDKEIIEFYKARSRVYQS